MDQNVKKGSKWSTLKDENKVKQLQNFNRKLQYGQNWLVNSVLNENLTYEWTKQIVVNESF